MAPNTHTHTHSEGQSNTIRNRCWSCLASHHIASLLFYYYYSDADVCHTLLDRLHSDVPDRHDVRITLIWIEYTICFFEFRHYYYYYVLLSEPVNPLCIFISVCSDGKWHEKFINIHCVGQDGRGSGVCIRVPDRAIYGIWRINLSNQPICSLCVMCVCSVHWHTANRNDGWNLKGRRSSGYRDKELSDERRNVCDGPSTDIRHAAAKWSCCLAMRYVSVMVFFLFDSL